MNLNKFDLLIKDAVKLKQQPKEKNIFSLGGKGHYENPISDLLAFFIDPNEEHRFGSLFIDSINEVAGFPCGENRLISPPRREVATEDDKRIDILLEGEGFVIAIENKIRHLAINPFDSYDAYLEKYHKGRNVRKIILSVRNDKATSGVNWVSITYKQLIDSVRKNLSTKLVEIPYSKWIVLLREFLLNIEHEYKESPVNSDRIEFAKKNYQAIREMMAMMDEYTKHLNGVCEQAIRAEDNDDVSDVFTRQENWGQHGIAIRLYKKQWQGKTNITVLLKPDGNLNVRAYIYDVLDDNEPTLEKNFDRMKYPTYWVEAKSIRCYGILECNNIDECIVELKDLSARINNYYFNK